MLVVNYSEHHKPESDAHNYELSMAVAKKPPSDFVPFPDELVRASTSSSSYVAKHLSAATALKLTAHGESLIAICLASFRHSGSSLVLRGFLLPY